MPGHRLQRFSRDLLPAGHAAKEEIRGTAHLHHIALNGFIRLQDHESNSNRIN